MNIKIGDKIIGKQNKPFIIAEMSGNHNQSLEKALRIVDAAAEAGVDALKLQTYTADTMTLDVENGDFVISEPSSLWKNRSLYTLYEEAHTPWDWHEAIFNRCREHGIIPFSSPFDETAVDFLETLDVELYKIASFEITDLPLIRRVAQTGKPIIMSTGMATMKEISEAVETAQQYGAGSIILLKCTSTYPAEATDTNLVTIPHLQQTFNCIVGLSDHTMGIGVSVASIAFGASVIEKHFTLDRSEGGVDAAFSMEPHEMKMLVQETAKAHLSLGTIHYGPTEREKASLKFRRSIYVKQQVNKGEMITAEHIKIVRPGYGLAPKYINQVIGRRAQIDLIPGTALTWELIE